ncbi:MAG: PolC-type DNA polymerase III [Oscillospiraceae bacterium]|nr:PolC-type DNA polymerase III [Oscillospiraceae bacterium]
MENITSLREIFSEYAFENGLGDGVLRHMDIDREARKVTVEATLARYVRAAEIERTEKEIARQYLLGRLEIQPTFPPRALEELDFAELSTLLIREYSPAAGSLAGCVWAWADGGIALRLRGNGRDALLRQMPKVQNYLAVRFGRRVEITVEAGHELEGQALFDATAQLRQEAITAVPDPEFRDKAAASSPARLQGETVYGKPFRGEPTPMKDLNLDMYKVIVEGEVFAVEHRELRKRNAWVICFDMTDYTGSVRINQFLEADKARPILSAIGKPGQWLKLQGKMSFNKYENDMVLEPSAILLGRKPAREDTAPEKRVELHLHTTMSSMDALTKTGEAVATAAKWGHRAIAITDHGGCQSFPDAMKAAGKAKVAGTGEPIKILYGCEGYFVNDVDDRIAVHGGCQLPLDTEIVAFDLETTGLSSQHDTIIEIGAVIFRGDEIVDRFQTFVKPGRPLPRKIIDLTGITDDMLRDARTIEAVLPEFLAFCGDRPLAAHNADFDVGFVSAACRRQKLSYQPVYLDTLILAQNLLPALGKYKLNIVADHLGLPDFNHHRAVDDAVTCGQMLQRFFAMLREQGLRVIDEINPKMETLRSGGKNMDGRHARHILLFAKNNTGLRNLYRLVSYGNLKYFKRVPRIPKSELQEWREGLLIGSACEAGELFQAVVSHKSYDECKRIASFYDFLEIQPLCNNRFLLEKGQAADEEELRDFNRTVVRLGEDLGKPVVATGDVHFLNPEDEIYRHILLASKKFEDCDKPLPLYFKTTDEMLEEFSYLGREKAYEIVVKNTNLIADMCETLRPVPHNLFPPAIEHSVQQLEELVYGKLHALYGENPPEIVQTRVDTEMHDIITCHYDVIYMSAQKLVKNSNDHGYLVGSRGSVGSSLVAYLSGITEVNSLPPHYRCPTCRYCSFEVPEGVGCGADLPDANCPRCGEKLDKDGFNIPFETFLGFGGDKVPDIDLNFSGEYQAKAHAYCVEMFGASHVFRAGTIGTVADKTAYGYAKKYLDERGITASKAEENRLASGCVDVKRTTGQHPGGLVVIPAENEIYDFCPVQHPADSTDTNIITTHFEYHSMEENLLKLDMLGHDDPTMIRMMEDLTTIDPTKIPLDDPETRSIFLSSKALGFENDPILGSDGTCGVPEFGTGFTRGMLRETKPREFDVLIRLSGFSHGTDVWLGNARDLILSGTATVSQAIGCRDDIMLYLIKCGMPEKRSFKIMEAVRKGRGLPEGAEQEMLKAGVPAWYIESCKKIKYLFPKAHAAAYVMMAFRIAWFKVHEPLAFYAAYFYRRSQKDGFDAAMMTRGVETVKEHLLRIKNSEEKTGKEDDLLTTLEMCYEFYLRGFEFLPMDLYASDATKFLIKDGKLRPPFVSVSGLGETAAWDILEGRKGRTFVSVEEFSLACPKVSRTHIENLREAGTFGDMPETSQITLF